MTTQTPTTQPPAIGPLTGEQLHAKIRQGIPGLVTAWPLAASAYRDAYNALAAELWPPAPPPEPVLRAWTAEEAARHCRYWFREKVHGEDCSLWFPVETVDLIGDTLMICDEWKRNVELLADWECTAEPWPGGKIEPGETYMDAAIRELAEETTVCAEALRAIDTLDVIVREPDGALKFHYVLVAVLCRFIDGTPVAGDDVHDAGWFDPAQIAATPQIFLDRVAGLAARALNPAMA
jgi:ADP-ribose pyrophosphatase YjhB (NUDIX family)